MNMLLLIWLNVPLIWAKMHECIIQSSPKIRTFHSLRDYQANKVPFNPHSDGFLGNCVNFDFYSIDRILTNSFITYESDKIVQLNLSKKEIVTVENGAFNTLFCLHYLDLSGNFITNLTEGMFEGLDNLKVLNVSDNMIPYIPHLVFSNLRNIKQIDLSSNVIKRIDRLAIHNITSLEELSLAYNKIKMFPTYCFEESENLKVLDLHSNYLSIDNMDMFRGLDNLETLNLSKNHLATLNFTNSTYIWEYLKVLNLSENILGNIDVPGLRRSFPSLNLLDINDNNFFCTDLMVIIETLKYEKIVVAKGTYFNNYSVDDIYCKYTITTVATVNISEEIPLTTISRTENDEWHFDNSVRHWLGLIAAISCSVVLTIALYYLFKKGIAANMYNNVMQRVGPSVNAEYISLNS